jgi:multidrug transporter EmrE-like cation transporter
MLAGVVFSFLSAMCASTGNILEKLAVSRMPDISARHPAQMIRGLLTSRQWLLGLIMSVAGLGLLVLALSLAPIAVAQSIASSGIVLMVVASRLYLHEPLRRNDIVGLGVVVVAVVLVSASLRGSDNIVGLGGSWTDIAFAVAPTVLVVILIFAWLRLRSGNTAVLYGTASGLLYGAAALGMKGASTLVTRYGLVASVPHVFVTVYPYLTVVGMILALVAFQIGLQRSRIAVMGSVSSVVASTYLVAVGMLVFGEHLPTDRAAVILRLTGFAGVLIGTCFLAGGE